MVESSSEGTDIQRKRRLSRPVSKEVLQAKTVNPEDSQERQAHLDYPAGVINLLAAALFHGASIEVMYKTATIHDKTKSWAGVLYIVYHCSALIGSYFSDHIYGVYKTMVYTVPFCFLLSIVLVISFSQSAMTIMRLTLVALTIPTGSVIICLLVLASDQFVLPFQKEELSNFFLWYFFMRKLGYVAATVIDESIKKYICSDSKQCTVAVAAAVVLFGVECLIYFLGRKAYRMSEPRTEGKLTPFRMFLCCLYAGVMGCSKHKQHAEHWLDRGNKKFGSELVSDLKKILNMLILFAVFLIFWTVYYRYEQTLIWEVGSKLDCNIGKSMILPENIFIISEVFAVLWIIVLRYGMHPVMESLGLKYPLQYIVCGGFIVAIGLLMSAILTLWVEYQRPPSQIKYGRGELRIYNPTECHFSLNSPHINLKLIPIGAMSFVSFPDLRFTGQMWINYTLLSYCKYKFPHRGMFNLTERKAASYYFREGDLVFFEDNPMVAGDGKPLVRLLANTNVTDTAFLKLRVSTHLIKIEVTDIKQRTFEPGVYKHKETKLYMSLGDVSVILYDRHKNNLVKHIHVMQANTISILYVFPVHFVSYIGRLLISIHGQKLAYIEAPDNMKTACEALWFIATGLGYMFMQLIDFKGLFPKLAQNILMCTVLEITSILIFAYFAAGFTYSNESVY